MVKPRITWSCMPSPWSAMVQVTACAAVTGRHYVFTLCVGRNAMDLQEAVRAISDAIAGVLLESQEK